MSTLYLTLKWLHIVAIISWMAGILYLYRLLIYLAEHHDHAEIYGQLSLMAKRLYRIITLPAMVAAFILGLGLSGTVPHYMTSGWFMLKFLMVLGLAASTLYAGRLVRGFAEHAANLPTSKRLRLLNELPTLLMIIIVGLVVFKPF